MDHLSALREKARPLPINHSHHSVHVRIENDVVQVPVHVREDGQAMRINLCNGRRFVLVGVGFYKAAGRVERPTERKLGVKKFARGDERSNCA